MFVVFWATLLICNRSPAGKMNPQLPERVGGSSQKYSHACIMYRQIQDTDLNSRYNVVINTTADCSTGTGVRGCDVASEAELRERVECPRKSFKEDSLDD